MRFFLGCLPCILPFLLAAEASAQEQAIVEQLAPVLAAEDAREWQQDLFQRSLLTPDSVVQRVTAVAAGRIGDLRATPLLVRTLDQPDTTVRVAAAFALGLLRDSAAVEPLIQRLTGLPPLDAATAVEAVTALAKTGGRRSADFFAAVLRGQVALSQVDPMPATSQILLEAWRLGSDAPADALLPFARDTVVAIRWRAVYSLGRLRAPAAANQLIAALRDEDPATRAVAARALIRDYIIAAKLAPRTIGGVLTRAVDDQDPGVRINALRSVASYRDSALAPPIAWRVDDPVPNVRVEAAATLGELGGSAATAALVRVLEGKGFFALRRAAMLGLARADTDAFGRISTRWRSSRDWRDRAAAAEGWALAGRGGTPWFITDADGRVVAAGLQAWAAEVEGPDPALIAAGRRLLAHPDAAARSVAGDIVSRAGDVGD
ncbi:MAG: HEAT repeat domain-containing protein, partial [Gemmatimonadota bacterium]|nr:HEAT repeat domain-containing protein [Gemmatimonadota bacterium]